MMHNPCARHALLATCVLVLLGCADRDRWPSLLDVPPLPDTAPVVPDSLLNPPAPEDTSAPTSAPEDTSAPGTNAPTSAPGANAPTSAPGANAPTSAPTSTDQSEP